MTDSPDPASDDDGRRRIEAIAEEFLARLQAGERPDPADVLAAHPDLAEPLERRLTLVERLFQAGRNAQAVDGPRVPAERAQRLKCPHCGNRIQLVEPRPKEVTCINCGSSFRLEPGTTATYRNAGPGGTIGRFKILELLGRGAFGEVYKARDPQLDRFVALKVPRADYFATPEDEQRFLREARSAAGLRHPSIVQVYEIAHERGSPYIVSDYIEGLTLADLISGGRPAFRESAELVAQLADALDYAHRQKVVHRDIKPSNILLATGGGISGGEVSGRGVSGGAGIGARLDTHYAPFLADFGLARRDEGEITVTLDGQVLGTPAYMSPEQAAGDHARVDGRSDVYGLGVVLYELLSGELPFRGSRRMLLHQVLNDEPRAPRTLNDQIPRDLETICLKAMAKEPARRYLTAADFRDDLRRFLRGDPIAARRVGRSERTWRWCRRNPLPAGLAAAVTVTLLVGTIVSLHFAQRAVAKAADEARERKRADDKADEARHNLYAVHMNLAQDAYEGAQISKVLQILDLYRQPSAGDSDLRGFEWYYLDRLCHTDLCTLKLDRESPSVAFDAGCQHVAAILEPDTIKVFNIRTGDVILSVSKAGCSFAAVAISADGQRIVAIANEIIGKGRSEPSLQVWDTQSGKEILTAVAGISLLHHNRLVFSPDGRWIASAKVNDLLGGAAGDAIVMDALNGKVVLTLGGENVEDEASGLRDSLRDVVFSPDSTLIATRGLSFATLWDVATGKRTMTIEVPSNRVFFRESLAFSPDGQRLATGGDDRTVGVWDTATGDNVFTLSGHSECVTSVSFAPDGQRLASGSDDSTVRIWDLNSGHSVLTLRGHTSAITDVAFASDGWRIASVDSEGNVKLWDSMTSHAAYRLDWQIAGVHCVAFSPDGRLVASGSGSEDGSVKIWDVAAKRTIQTIHVNSSVSGISFSADGGRLAGASGQFARIWDVATGDVLASLSGPRTVSSRNRDLAQIVFSPDGRRLAGVESLAGQTTESSFGIYVWDVASRQLEWTVRSKSKPGEDHRPGCIAFSPDGQRLAFNFGSQLNVQDLDAGKVVLTFTSHSDPIQTIVYSPDGRQIVSGADDAIRFWDAVSGQEVPRISSFTGKAEGLAFAAGGQRLISSQRSTTTTNFNGGVTYKVWDVVTRQEVFTLSDRSYPFSVSPDGSRVAFGIDLLESSPLTADAKTNIEANGLVGFLYATEERSRARVVHRLRTFPAISDAVRRESLALAEQLDDYVAGLSALNSKDFASGIRLFTEAIAHSQNNVDAVRKRGDAYYSLGEFDKALADYEEAIRLDPNSASILTDRGRAWHAKGELDKALADYNEAIRLDPQNVSPFVYRWCAMALFSRAAVSKARGEYDNALADYDEGISLVPGDSEAYHQRGFVWHAKGEIDKALADYDEAIRLSPKNLWPRCSGGATWYQKGDFKKGIAYYDDAILLDPKHSLAYAWRGDGWSAQGEYDKALANYDQSIALDPSSSVAHNSRARLRATCPDEKYRNGAKAIEDAAKAAELLDWKDFAILDTLAAAYAESGQFDKAVEWQEKAIELAPEEQKEGLRSRLKLYQEGKPYREEPKN